MIRSKNVSKSTFYLGKIGKSPAFGKKCHIWVW